MVGVVAGSPVEYGLWQVDPATGALQPHDVLADKIVTVLDSRCSDESLATLYTPTPISTETPIPESTPVVASGDQARHVVWVHLSQCLTFDAALLEAQRVDVDWFVQSTSTAPEDYGVWRVNVQTGALSPHSGRAENFQTFLDSDCDPEFITVVFTPHAYPDAYTHTDSNANAYACSNADVDACSIGTDRRRRSSIGVVPSGGMLPGDPDQRPLSQVGPG